MSERIKVFGVESYFKTHRIYINDKWIPYEIETLVIDESIICCTYMDRKDLPGDSGTYLPPQRLGIGQVVEIQVKTPGEDDIRLEARAEYIGTVEGVKGCMVHAAKDTHDIGVLVSYFKIKAD